MKSKKIIFFVLFLISMFSNSFITLTAHSKELEIEYDSCLENSGDGELEKWYEFVKENTTRHFPHSSNEETTTIKYYISPTAKNDDSITWNTGLTPEQAEEIVSKTVMSMKKWNNVYFFERDADGNYIVRKLVDIVEGSSTDHNVIIYPARELNSNAEDSTENGAIAWVDALISPEEIETNNGISHVHGEYWTMHIMTTIYSGNYTSGMLNKMLERTGAHELGHILGLRDIDSIENGNNSSLYHHEELLMGYSSYSYLDRQTEITYKDLVGVAITRGYHTDADHKWICVNDDPDEIKFRLICSICNGVKKVDSLDGYEYVHLNACNKNHELADGNMMAVASYGDKDYYKCKYCRYVAPFNSNVSQNYTYVPISYSQHQKVNQVVGLEYGFAPESHTLVDGHCDVYGYTHTHNFTEWKYFSESKHVSVCECGLSGSTKSVHTIRAEDVGKRFAFCLQCGHKVDLTKFTPIIGVMPTNITQVSINGSYVLPNGIIVLVSEDIEAYENGTLVFYNRNELPEAS